MENQIEEEGLTEERLRKMPYSELVATGTSQLGVEYTGQVKPVFLGLCLDVLREDNKLNTKQPIKTTMKNQKEKQPEEVKEVEAISPDSIAAIVNDASLKTKSDKIKKLLEIGLIPAEIVKIADLKASNPQIYGVRRKMSTETPEEKA